MAGDIPFDIQTVILKKLPVKSLIRFRCVSQHWKSLIESFEFIKNYQTMNDRHLLVGCNIKQFIADKNSYLSIIDNDTFPQHMSRITFPLSINELWDLRILGSSYGIICFHGYRKDYAKLDLERVVFWNPSIRKSVSVLLEPSVHLGNFWVGFGVCPETCDPKLVKIDDIEGIPEVQVYTLSSRAWKKVSLKPPYIPCGLRYDEGMCVEGFIYWLARDDWPPALENGSNYIVSFDLSNDEFGKVYLPISLQRSEGLRLSKCNECLTVFHFWNVWVMKDDGVTRSFTMMFHFETIYNVLELRKNGEAIIENNDDHAVNPILQVYDPCSGRVNDIKIPCSRHEDIGKTFSSFSISSYMETLLLLDQ